MKLYYWDRYWKVVNGVPWLSGWSLAYIPFGETNESVRELLRKRGFCTCLVKRAA